MSVDAHYFANAQQLVCQELTNTSVTKIGATATDNTTYVAGIWMTGAAVTATLYWYDGSTQHEIWNGAVTATETVGGANSTFPLPIALRKDDEIRVKGANGLKVTILYVQLLKNQRST